MLQFAGIVSTPAGDTIDHWSPRAGLRDRRASFKSGAKRNGPSRDVNVEFGHSIAVTRLLISVRHRSGAQRPLSRHGIDSLGRIDRARNCLQWVRDSTAAQITSIGGDEMCARVTGPTFRRGRVSPTTERGECEITIVLAPPTTVRRSHPVCPQPVLDNSRLKHGTFRLGLLRPERDISQAKRSTS